MVDAVTRFEKSLGIYDVFQSKGLNADADVLITLGKLANQLGEDKEIATATSHTPAGIDAEISEVNAQIKEYLTKGEKVPAHLNQRRTQLFERKYKD